MCSRTPLACSRCNSTKHVDRRCPLQLDLAAQATSVMHSRVQPVFTHMTRDMLKNLLHVTFTEASLSEYAPKTCVMWNHARAHKPVSKMSRRILSHWCRNAWQENRNAFLLLQSSTEADAETSCPICMDDFDKDTNTCTSTCGHKFCSCCFSATICSAVNRGSRYGTPSAPCPLCRTNMLAPTRDAEARMGAYDSDY